MSTRTVRLVLLKEKHTSLIYGEQVSQDKPPMFHNAQIHLSKWAFDGTIPSEIEITVNLPK